MAEHAHITPTLTIDGMGGGQVASPSRRAALGSGLLAFTAAASAVAGCAPVLAADRTPIAVAAARLSQLSALEERDLTNDQFDDVTSEQLELQDFITDCQPQTVADTVVLLMVAAAEIARKALNDDGSFSHEHGEVLVRRVLHFLGERERIDLEDVGGAFFFRGKARKQSH